ncbi:hypothetical protein ATANTOWER_021588 [Ataeniobius toweri]|uniref:Uncharacterized protein n=1 Tax=Ataeniobius toweri TaxID=208326 RepID=A0ABU7C9T1_9TELE|nr:hypothetical protein [Ataeniobius toweri]
MDENSSSEAIYENTQELEKGKKTKICYYPLLLSLGILSILLLASIAIITWSNQQIDVCIHLGLQATVEKAEETFCRTRLQMGSHPHKPVDVLHTDSLPGCLSESAQCKRKQSRIFGPPKPTWAVNA